MRRRALSNGDPKSGLVSCLLFMSFLLPPFFFFSSPFSSFFLAPPDSPFLTAEAAAVSLRSLRAKKNFASGLVRRVDSQDTPAVPKIPRESHKALAPTVWHVPSGQGGGVWKCDALPPPPPPQAKTLHPRLLVEPRSHLSCPPVFRPFTTTARASSNGVQQ